MDENEFVPVGSSSGPVTAAVEDDGFVPVIRNGVPVMGAQDEPMAPRVAGWQPGNQEMADAEASQGYYGQVLDAFGAGLKKGWGTDIVDKWMADQKMVRGTEPGDFDGVRGVIKAANEVFLRTAAKTIEYPLRALNAGLHALGDAVTEAGGGRSSFAGEMVQVAEMALTAGKMGPTGSVGLPERAMQPWYSKADAALRDMKPKITVDLNVAQDLGIIGPKRPDFATAAPGEVGQFIRDNPIKAYHGSPHSFEAFSSEKIGTGEGAQAYGHGIYLAEAPEVGRDYARRLAERNVDPDNDVAFFYLNKYDGDPKAALAAFDADAAASRKRGVEYSEQDLLDETKIREDIANNTVAGNVYETRVHATKDELLDWDAPLRDQSPQVQAKLKAAMAQSEDAAWFEARGDSLTGQEIYDMLGNEGGKTNQVKATAILNEAGIPGLKYLDEGSRGTWEVRENPKGFHVTQVLAPGIGGRVSETYFPTREAAQAWVDQTRTRNLVIFDDSRVEIVSRNGEPIERPQTAMAKQAENAGDVVRGDVPAPAKTEWMQRFEKSVDRITSDADVAALIRASAVENGEFAAARAGPVEVGRAELVSDVTGVPLRDIDLNTVGQRIPSDVQMANAMDMIESVTRTAWEKMKAVNIGGGIDALIELQAALMRRDLFVEHFVGLRAEWSRTGMVLQGKDAAVPVKSKATSALGEFLDVVKDEATLKEWLGKNKGRSIDDLKELAKRADNLDPKQLAQLLQNARKPNFAENMHRYWVSSILSGLYGYGVIPIADASFMAWNYMVETPIAGALSKAQQLLNPGKNIERVYMGESFAQLQGVVEAFPDAIVGAWETIKSGDVAMLPREIVKEMTMPGGVNAATGVRGGNRGAVDVVLTSGQRALATEQSFFKILADRAEVHRLAYRETANEGFQVGTREFWKRKNEHMVTPKGEWLDAGVKHSEYMTWVNDMGKLGESFDKLRRNSPLKWVVPFFRSPGNVINAAVERLPGVDMLYSKETRNALAGKGGKVVRDADKEIVRNADGTPMRTGDDIARVTQLSRSITGGMLLAYGVYMALGDQLTDSGPVDPQENAEWKLTHAPNSIRIGDQQVALQKFGPYAIHLAAAATLARAGKYMTEEEYGTAAVALLKGVGDITLNASGMKGLSDLFKARANPERYGETYIANFAAGFIPLSSMLGQTASMLDPQQREAKTALDVFKNKIPGARETLFPVRDWSGMPVANDRAGLKAFMAMRAVNFDPVDHEMQALKITPAKVDPSINGVRLTAEQYDELQNTGAIITRNMLNAYVNMPSWYNMSEYAREEWFRGGIAYARKTARSQIMLKYWGTDDDVLMKQIVDKVNHITGDAPRQFNKKATPLQP